MKDTVNKNIEEWSKYPFCEQTQKEINILANSIDQNCQSKQFLINIKKNKQYPKFGSTEDWKKFCLKLKKTQNNFKDLMNKNIKVYKNNAPAGLITGYYEPTIKVSFIKNQKYKHPILKKNKMYNLKSRSFIDKNYNVEDVILWTDDYINLFFLQIQGSGIGIFEDGKKVKVAYEGNNNLPYKSIGKILIKQNKIKAWKKHNEMTMNFVVPHGKVKFVIFKDPPRKNQYSEYIVSRDNYLRLNIPPNLWVGFSGVDSGESIVCNIADLNHDPKEVDKINLSEIDYSWKND